MAKLSAEQQKQLADLEALRDADDEETVVWVRNKSGHETRLTGDRAERWLKANGYDHDDAEDSSAREPLDAAGAPKTPKPKDPKTKTPKAGDDQDDDQDVTPDEQPANRNRRPIF